MSLSYKTIWISDIHLGTKTCQANRVLKLLKSIKCEKLYLVGDILDLIKLRRFWFWPDSHSAVVRRILKMADQGVEVFYIPGNHDDKIRSFCGYNFGNVLIIPYAIHKTVTGKNLLITHGDQFDLVVQNSPFLTFMGAVAYDFLIRINRVYNKIVTGFGFSEFSLSQAIKFKVKLACKYISNFEKLLAKQARSFNVNGVVCGHIHRAEINLTDFEGIEYYNCGDWVESACCLAEDNFGNISILRFSDIENLVSLDHSAEPHEEPRHQVYADALKELRLVG